MPKAKENTVFVECIVENFRIAIGGNDVKDFKRGDKFNLPEAQAERHIRLKNVREANSHKADPNTANPKAAGGEGESSETPLEDMKKAELQALADELGVEYKKNDTVETLISVIKEKQAELASGEGGE